MNSRPGGQQLAPAVAQVVENNSFVAILGQQAGHSTTYVPCPPGYKDLHKKIYPFVNDFE